MTLVTKTLLVTFVLMLIAVGVTISIPVPATHIDSQNLFYTAFILSSLMATNHLVAAALFFVGLRDYREKLRLAYGSIALGIILAGIGTLQLPIIDAFNLTETFWVQSGIIIVPFLLSGLCIYLGVRRFALLVGTNTLLARAGVVISAAFLLAILTTFLPHTVGGDELAFDVSNAILTWATVLELSAACLALAIRRHVGAHYTNAVAWLSLALLGAVLVEVLALINAFAFGEGSSLETIYSSVAVLNGFIFIKAGLAFNKTRDF